MIEYEHVPVMATEVIDALKIRESGVYVDGTLGGGGHAGLIADRLSPLGMLIGIDRDTEALAHAEKNLKEKNCKKEFVHSNYADIKDVLSKLKIDGIDGALLDLGVSSYQLDNPERGFSYMRNAPLDMRMDGTSTGLTAADVVNGYSERELVEIIKAYGEERWASRIAKFIVASRAEKPLESTDELTEVIKAAIPAAARRDGPHPAKRTFQAIRIEVNSELSLLSQAVTDFIDVLRPGGRLAIITFHSLEDRIVKQVFEKRENPCECPKDLPVCVCGKVSDVKRVGRKPLIAGDEELEINPRARSAKLRVIEKR
jgi:16S rRNA (cytosine1402-N4)-methyltransferase